MELSYSATVLYWKLSYLVLYCTSIIDTVLYVCKLPVSYHTV